ncbi:TPR repeat-containing protein [Catenovulum agarivorans DS-2]|uniref:TPR repeat-containing protein n=2 Tax=Catenovulum agarivorans TaxID=1172192 RepID=W7Q615_9ALTE|nr:TPR repeat-containing protein [Catenovulum agarivorans DS-2]
MFKLARSTIKIVLNLAALIVLLSTLQGCVSTDDQTQVSSKNNNGLGAWVSVSQQQNQQALDEEKLWQSAYKRKQQLADLYQQILTATPDNKVVEDIRYRLAELYTYQVEQVQGDELVASDLEDNSVADSAQKSNEMLRSNIERFKELLASYPNNSNNPKIYYQLAKSYSLLGETLLSLQSLEKLAELYPTSPYLEEVYFRIGDIYFSHNNYPRARDALTKALAVGQGKYQNNALYMLAWSQFKLSDYQNASQHFIKLIVQSGEVAKLKQGGASSMITDAQRALILLLSQQETGQQEATPQQTENPLVALIDHAQQQGLDTTELEPILYQKLAQFWLAKDLKNEALATYLTYIERKPENFAAAEFLLAVIGLYPENSTKAFAYKVQFVEDYFVGTNAWNKFTDQQQQQILANLSQFSLLKARQLYATAQDTYYELEKDEVVAYRAAAIWFEKYLLSQQKLAQLNLTTDVQDKLIQQLMLAAQARYIASDYVASIEHYQKLVQLQPDNADSLYSLIIVYQQALKHLNQAQPQQKFTELQLSNYWRDFISLYPADRRALYMARQLADYAYAQQDLVSLISQQQFIIQHLDAKTKDKQQASLLVANLQYQLKQYVESEQSYQQALLYIDKNNQKDLFKQTQNLVAASAYFYAQALLELEPEQAAKQFLKVADLAFSNEYTQNALTQAADILMEQVDKSQGVAVLKRIRKQYPNSDYAKAVPAKLAKVYTDQQQWSLAAKQLELIAKNTNIKQPEGYELARQAQYTAAEYYAKDNDMEAARLALRTYAHNYPKPFDMAQEVRLKMAEFYTQPRDLNKKYFWYRKIVQFHKKEARLHSGEVLQRSEYLASFAAFELAKAHHQTFARVKLVVPLQQSMAKKQQAMKDAIYYYQQVMDLALIDFVPQANFHLAELYRTLAREIMQSERPAELDELALEEYELILEEVAYPFEEKAIELHQVNLARTWTNQYDEWIAQSLDKLAALVPAQYKRSLIEVDIYEELN